MKKFAVYTCITGGYDAPPAHAALCPDADYWCFVGQGEKRQEWLGEWRVVELPFCSGEAVRDARRAKLLPHRLLPDYEYTLWVDANIGIMDPEFYALLQRKMTEEVPLSGLWHPFTDCAYEEAVRVVHSWRERLCRVLRTVHFLRREHFPHHFGMFETGVMLRHNTPEVREFCERWWWMLSRFSHRDQLSFPYCMWKSGFSWDSLLPPGQGVRNHPWFRYDRHTEAAPSHQGFIDRKWNGLREAALKWYASQP